MVESLAIVGAPPTASGLSALVYILVAVVAGGGLQLLWQFYMHRKRGGKEEEALVSRISGQVIGGAKELMEEYRIQLEAADRQIDSYLKQMSELNRLLGDANARIARLESERETSSRDYLQVRQELDDALVRRDALVKELDELRRRLAQLEAERLERETPGT